MKRKKLHKLCIFLLALAFVGSSAAVLLQLHQQQLADRSYEDAARIALSKEAVKPSPPSATEPERSAQLTLPELPEPQLPLDNEPDETVQESLPEQAELLLDLDLDALRKINEIGRAHV